MNIFIVSEINLRGYTRADFIWQNYSFDAVKLTRNADFYKYKY